ncbi:MAG: type Z 30S ribosomal protein S14 [bacterium]
MARKSLIVKSKKEQKYKVREYNRCQICGRPRGYYRDFGLCRICFREMAHQGLLPGVKKVSW